MKECTFLGAVCSIMGRIVLVFYLFDRLVNVCCLKQIYWLYANQYSCQWGRQIWWRRIREFRMFVLDCFIRMLFIWKGVSLLK